MAQAQSDVLGGTLEVAGTPGVQVIGRTPWQIFWTRFRRDRIAIAGALFVTVLIITAVAAPIMTRLLVHHGPNDLFADSQLNSFGLPNGPSTQFWFGVDLAGRDVFVRTLYGARTSLVVALLATGLSVVIGIVLGVTAGYFRGVTDTIVSRAIDVVMSMPILLFAIGLAAAC